MITKHATDRAYKVLTANNLLSLECYVEADLIENKRFVPCGGAQYLPKEDLYSQALVETPDSRLSRLFTAFLLTGYVAAVIGSGFAFIWWVLTR